MRPKDKSQSEEPLVKHRRLWPTEVRLKVAQAVVDRGLRLSDLADALGISRNTLVDWVQRYRRRGVEGFSDEPRPRQVRKEMNLRREAVIAAKKAQPEQGAKRIRDELARFGGVGVSDTTVRRILREEGLLTERPAEKSVPAPRQFERAEPNQLWQSDIFTFLLRRHQRLYVAAFMDDCSRYLVSLVMAHHQRSSLVLEALQRGIAECGAPREILTDQGRQYTAWRGQTDFEEELRRQGIQHIKSRPHHPQTLGKIERFWKTLWEEFLSRTVFADFEDCQRRVGLFVQAYNFRRPHQGIAGLVPAGRFFRAAPQVREAIEKGVASNAMALARERPARKPFYLVGRLGDQDVSIVAFGRGLLVRLGATEQTIALGEEGEDEATRASRRAKEEPEPPYAEVALELGSDRPGGAGAVPAGLERAVGGEAGDAGDRGGGDLPGQLLPDGDPRTEGDAEGALAGGERGRGGKEPGSAAFGSGGEGQEAGAGQEEDAAAPGHDAQGGAGGAGEAEGQNALDESWEEAFAGLEGGERFDDDERWRERPLTWSRKLAGADEVSDDRGLRGGAEGPAGATGALPGDHGGAGGGAHGERGGPEAGDVPQSLPDAAAPVSGGPYRRDEYSPGGPAETGSGRASLAGEDGQAGAGQRAAEEAREDGGPNPGAGPGDAQGPDGESQS